MLDRATLEALLVKTDAERCLESSDGPGMGWGYALDEIEAWATDELRKLGNPRGPAFLCCDPNWGASDWERGVTYPYEETT